MTQSLVKSIWLGITLQKHTFPGLPFFLETHFGGERDGRQLQTEKCSVTLGADVDFEIEVHFDPG